MDLVGKKTYFTPEEITSSMKKIFHIKQDFEEKIDDEDYPCLGAKSALNTGHYRLGIYDRMGADATTRDLATDLSRYIQETLDSDSQYMTMIAVFTDNVDSEIDFENRLWAQLQSLHDAEKAQQTWDPKVSSDPENPSFSFSFQGTAFFIVGLHPLASRKSRKFRYCAMAFNLHRQFEQLRETDRFEKMKQVIRAREIKYEGTINPMLSDHGDGLEAPQYSGREVGQEWKCPFRL
ncbi:MAG: guanitoxin biosynthesis heme-dependent pre-guanitoxin N-hydroxylase GntA [Sphingobacterium sp.]